MKEQADSLGSWAPALGADAGRQLWEGQGRGRVLRRAPGGGFLHQDDRRLLWGHSEDGGSSGREGHAASSSPHGRLWGGEPARGHAVGRRPRPHSCLLKFDGERRANRKEAEEEGGRCPHSE